MPSPVVAASYALHLVATVIWIGGLVSLAFLASPLLARLPASERDAARQISARRFVPLAWLCLAIIVASGLTQMSANPGSPGPPDVVKQVRCRRVDLQLLRLSAVSGLLVLLLTAIARASN